MALTITKFPNGYFEFTLSNGKKTGVGKGADAIPLDNEIKFIDSLKNVIDVVQVSAITIDDGTDTFNYNTSAEVLDKLTELNFFFNVSGGGASYNVYTASLDILGAVDPVPNVLENTLGAITFDRYGTGSYNILSDGLFIEDKTIFFITLPYNAQAEIYRTDDDTLSFIVRNNAGTLVDLNTTNIPFEIRVYP